MSYPGANYHAHKQQHYQQNQGYAPPPGPPQGYGYGGDGYGGGGYGGGPGGYAPPPGPPPGQYGGGGYGGYQGQGGYNTGYTSPPPSDYNQGMPHPHHEQYQYNAPPEFGGQNSYAQQYGPPPGPPPMHYGAQEQQYNVPSQYQGGQFAMHSAPTGDQSQYYSNLSGRRKALCIGINYTGTRSQLNGCHNDARNMAKFLCERYNYKEEDIVMLLDTPDATQMSLPTRANIIRGMQWLVKDARPNDALFFHYSGHGGQQAAVEADEEDGYDENIYPLDHEVAGTIVDNDMHRLLVTPLPQGCRLTAIFDCCHSGSALDLPYMYSTKGVLKEPNMLADAGSGALGAATSYMRGDLGGVFKSVMGVGKRIMNGDKASEYTKQTRSSNADVISWSGCKDTQTSADTSIQGQSTGAMSYSFITALTKYPQQNYLQLLNTIRDELQGKYSQKPQLACSHPLDLNLLFVC